MSTSTLEQQLSLKISEQQLAYIDLVQRECISMTRDICAFTKFTAAGLLYGKTIESFKTMMDKRTISVGLLENYQALIDLTRKWSPPFMDFINGVSKIESYEDLKPLYDELQSLSKKFDKFSQALQAIPVRTVSLNSEIYDNSQDSKEGKDLNESVKTHEDSTKEKNKDLQRSGSVAATPPVSYYWDVQGNEEGPLNSQERDTHQEKKNSSKKRKNSSEIS